MAFIIKGIQVERGEHHGRSKEFQCRFSPKMNAIIGGRGVGKTSLLRFIALALGANPGTKPHSLLEKTKITVLYHKDGIEYRLVWSNGSVSASTLKDGKWEDCEAGRFRELFPVDFFDQKQIYELATQEGNKWILDKIDAHPDTDSESRSAKMREHESAVREINFKISEKEREILEADGASAELGDVLRQIKVMESTEHKEILEKYKRSKELLSQVKLAKKSWWRLADGLKDVLNDSIVNKIYNPVAEKEVNVFQEQCNSAMVKVQEAADTISSLHDKWDESEEWANCKKLITPHMEKYSETLRQWEEDGIDPSRYNELLKRRQELHKQTIRASALRQEVKDLTATKGQALKDIEGVREALFSARQLIFSDAVKDNKSLDGRMVPYGEPWAKVEPHIRELLRCEKKFDNDMAALSEAYGTGGYEFVKQRIMSIIAGKSEANDKRFARHVKDLSQSDKSEFELWFPKDDAELTWENRGIDRLSPGQKASALLSFILPFGDKPLIMDQPEDDLDNRTITKAIVPALREQSEKRQIIVVTHNPNIVVGTFADLVFSLGSVDGETVVEHAESTTDTKMIKAICDALEGGKMAFEQRKNIYGG